MGNEQTGDRVLGVVRLSRDRDDSTSVERQRAAIERWADAYGKRIVAWVEDVDVSGSVAPWKRPSLGPWLPDFDRDVNARPERRSVEWDCLVVWRLDRLARDAYSLSTVTRWAQDSGKTIVSTSEQLDLSSFAGRMVTTVLAMVAEGELEAVKERAQASFKHLRQTGRWRGGQVPYGYRVGPHPSGEGKTLVPDDDGPRATAPILRGLVSRVIGGEAVNALARWLNEQGTPTPIDARA